MVNETEAKEDGLLNLATRIYCWYRKWLERNVEPEVDVISDIDLTRPEGRFELLILARLFNNRLREERAIEYFKKLKQWALSKGFSYQIGNDKVGMIDINIIKNIGHDLHKEFQDLVMNEFCDLPVSKRLKNYEGFICCAREFSKKDLKDYVYEVNGGDLLDIIFRRLGKCGIYVKSFLIIREMHRAGVWVLNQEDLWMCCVPDSKVRHFLNKNGFVPQEYMIKEDQKYTPQQLKNYSKIIWKYFNEPFEKRYFDLPIFRYVKVCAR